MAPPSPSPQLGAFTHRAHSLDDGGLAFRFDEDVTTLPETIHATIIQTDYLISTPFPPSKPSSPSQPLLASTLLSTPSRKRTSAARKQFLPDYRRYIRYMRYLKYDDIPDWMQDNDLIRRYYRPQMSFKQAALSLFALHNETFNTWSHLLGCLLIASLGWFTWHEQPPIVHDSHGAPCFRQGSTATKLPLYVFVLFDMYTLGISAFAHLFHVVSKDWCAQLWHLDHTGIAVGSLGAFIPICTYVFSCDDHWHAPLYITIACALSIMVVCCSMMDVFHTPPFRPYRMALQLSFAAWSLVPLVHAWVRTAHEPEARLGLMQVMAAISSCVLGGAVYAMRITDRLFFGKVDLIGSSHNIMHVMAVAGHVLQYLGGRTLWMWRSGQGACEAPVCGLGWTS